MFITATGAKVQDSRQSYEEWSGRWAQGQDRQVSKPGGREKRDWGKAGADTKMLVDLTNKTNRQQTNREHRYEYTGDNEEDG
jgi:hypothetical protein